MKMDLACHIVQNHNIELVEVYTQTLRALTSSECSTTPLRSKLLMSKIVHSASPKIKALE